MVVGTVFVASSELASLRREKTVLRFEAMEFALTALLEIVVDVVLTVMPEVVLLNKVDNVLKADGTDRALEAGIVEVVVKVSVDKPLEDGVTVVSTVLVAISEVSPRDLEGRELEPDSVGSPPEEAVVEALILDVKLGTTGMLREMSIEVVIAGAKLPLGVMLGLWSE